MVKAKRKMAKMMKDKPAPDPNAPPKHANTQGAGKKRWTMFVSYKNGMQTLTDGLAEAIGPDILKLKTEVTKIDKGKRTDGRQLYRLKVRGIGEIEADAVVLTTLSHSTAELVNGFDNALAATLATINCVSSATVNLVYRDEEIPRPLDANGFLVPKVENKKLMASTWTTSKWEHRAPEGYTMLRAFVGGAFNQDLVSLSDDEIISLVKKDLRDIMDIEADPIKVRVTRWPKSMPQYTLGHLDRVAVIREREAAHKGLFLAGASYNGVGIPDCLNNGRNSALEALEHVKK
jgi:oxygen-dependent protoporphyrinogen oxidase